MMIPSVGYHKKIYRSMSLSEILMDSLNTLAWNYHYAL